MRMASLGGGRNDYSLGEIIDFSGQDAIVVNIRNELGFEEFQVQILETGLTVWTTILSMSKKDLLDIDWNDDLMEAAPVPRTATPAPLPAPAIQPEPDAVLPPPRANPSRFPTLSASDIEKLANKRTEDSTDRQTNWGVRALKGDCLQYTLRLLQAKVQNVHSPFPLPVHQNIRSVCQI